MSASASPTSVAALDQSHNRADVSGGLMAEIGRQEQNAASYKTTLRHAMNILTWAQTYSKYTRIHQSQVLLLNISEIEDDKIEKSDCLDVYLCECSGIAAGPAAGPASEKQTISFGENACQAKFIIHYPPTFEHTSEGGINTEKHGSDMVSVIWNWDHNHPFKSLKAFRELDNSPLQKSDFVVATTLGLGWNENSLWFMKGKDPFFEHKPELFKKMMHYHVRVIRERMLSERAIKSDSLSESLICWSKQIAQDGFAEFKNEASFLIDLKGETQFETSSGKKIWSFKFMSKWQRVLLVRSGDTIFLDSTEKVCSGFDSEEDVFLSTILVKDGRNGHSFPVAFLLTNSQNDFVLADFFKKIKEYCQYTPKRILIDCDIAEKLALERVWPGTNIMSCRWHLMKGLKRKLITVNVNNLHQKMKKLPKQADADFDEILACPTRFHGAQKMAEFYSKYEDSPLIQRYIENRWRNYFKNSTSGTFLSSETFTDIMSSYNGKLTMPFMRASEHQRPDVLVYKLYKRLESVFRAEPTTKPPTRNQIDKKVKFFKGHGFLDLAGVLKSVFFEGDSRFSVQFLRDEPYYVNILHSTDINATCSCPSYSRPSWCLHIHMVFRWICLLERSLKKKKSPKSERRSPKEPVEKFLEELLENPLEKPLGKPLANQSQLAVFTPKSMTAIGSPPTNSGIKRETEFSKVDVKKIKLEVSQEVAKTSKDEGPEKDHKQIQKMVSSQQKPLENHSQLAISTSKSKAAIASPPTNLGVKRETEFPRVDSKKVKLEVSQGIIKIRKYESPRIDHEQIQKMVPSQQTFPMPMPDSESPCYSGPQADSKAPSPYSTPAGPNL
ncbi:hypothetical protein OXX80_010179, partial [Metschnikowia pulcherrima]